jgi:NAD(P)-dependent dehydrogenase (short-subunit alcohol dehydrogenase family)
MEKQSTSPTATTDTNLHVLLTGGTSGIGRELGKLFAEAGYPLIVVGRKEDTLNAAADYFRSFGAPHVHTIVADLASATWNYPASARINNLVYSNGDLYYIHKNTDDLVRVTLNNGAVSDEMRKTSGVALPPPGLRPRLSRDSRTLSRSPNQLSA